MRYLVIIICFSTSTWASGLDSFVEKVNIQLTKQSYLIKRLKSENMVLQTQLMQVKLKSLNNEMHLEQCENKKAL